MTRTRWTRDLVVVVAAAALAVAGCSSSGGSGVRSSPQETSSSSSQSVSIPVSSPAITPSNPITTSPATPACVSKSSVDGTLTMCPGEASIGDRVTITSDTMCGAQPNPPAALVFLGSKSYMGSGGGGVDVRAITRHGSGFAVSFVIPKTYVSGDPVNAEVPVTPGAYFFTTLPISTCYVQLQVVG